MSIIYTVNKSKYSSIFALQLLNVLGSVVTFEDRFNELLQKAETIKGRMILPSVRWKIEF